MSMTDDDINYGQGTRVYSTILRDMLPIFSRLLDESSISGSALNFDIDIQGQSLYCHTAVDCELITWCETVSLSTVEIVFVNLRSARLHGSPVLAIHLVHGCKVVHAGKENINLHNLVEVRSGSLQDGGEILYALMLRARLGKLCPREEKTRKKEDGAT